ncbi:MAG: translesion DNA synthesis-associated protein ImuA [Rhodoferax sp.]
MPTFPDALPLASVPAGVWRAAALAPPVAPVVASGEALLDAQLPGGGYPVGALTEIVQAPGVHCEWRLLAGALARWGTQVVLLVGAPQRPFGPALAAQGLPSRRLLWVQADAATQRLWAAEQALRCAGVDAVLLWLPGGHADALRRLQMAAAEHAKLLFVVRGAQAPGGSSPASLRLWAAYASDGVAADQAVAPLVLRVLKRRGPPLEHDLHLAGCTGALARLLALSAQALVSAGRPALPSLESAHALDCAADGT